MSNVRVRFAPSPTGHLHIGGLRTALFNWLFAHHHNGQYFLRIEDTDLERSKEEFTDSIISSLAWAGVTTKHPIMFQSQRFSVYQDVVQELLNKGKAYRCFCPVLERTDVDHIKYTGRCRSFSNEDITDKPYVVRFKLPLDRQEVVFDDLIRGRISFPIDQFDDFIIVRSDGVPVYNFVVVVDDAAMNITHIIRGEDHISNTPKQVLLYEALNFALPQFAHVPLIVGTSGKPLSKRDAATSVLEYQHEGYLAEALCNYLVRLGWAYGNQEIFTREELVVLFNIDDVGKSAGVFDKDKLDWINSQYIKKSSAQSLWECIIKDVDAALPQAIPLWNQEIVMRLVALYQDRIKTLKELSLVLRYLYQEPLYDSTIFVTMQDKQAFLEHMATCIASTSSYEIDYITDLLKKSVAEYKLKFADAAHALRYALTGSKEGVSVAGLIYALGKEEVIKRIRAFISKLHH